MGNDTPKTIWDWADYAWYIHGVDIFIIFEASYICRYCCLSCSIRDWNNFDRVLKGE